MDKNTLDMTAPSAALSGHCMRIASHASDRASREQGRTGSSSSLLSRSLVILLAHPLSCELIAVAPLSLLRFASRAAQSDGGASSGNEGRRAATRRELAQTRAATQWSDPRSVGGTALAGQLCSPLFSALRCAVTGLNAAALALLWLWLLVPAAT